MQGLDFGGTLVAASLVLAGSAKAEGNKAFR